MAKTGLRVALCSACLWLAGGTPVDAQSPAWSWAELPALPDTVGLAGAFVGVSNGALLVAGGANFPTGRPWDGSPKVWHDDIYVLTDPKGPWRIAHTKLPRPLGYGVVAELADGVLGIGGSDIDRSYADCFLMTWTGDDVRITPTAALPMPLANGCGTGQGPLAFVAGGIDSPTATECRSEVYTLIASGPPASWRWTRQPTWPGPARMLAVAGALDGDFYLLGGIRLKAGADGKPERMKPFLSDAYRFTPTADRRSGTWTHIADLPQPRAAGPSPALAITATTLALCGGDDGSPGVELRDAHRGFPPDVFGYDAVRNAWRTIARLPVQRVGDPVTQPQLSTWAPVTTGATRWQGQWVIPTGEARPGVRTPRVLSVQVRE